MSNTMSLRGSLGKIFNGVIFFLVLFLLKDAWARPITSALTVSTQENVAVAFSLISTKDRPSDRLSYYYSNAAHGSITQETRTSATLVYTPQSGFFGSDQFTYYTMNQRGQKSNTSTVSLTITQVNDAPIANEQSVTTTNMSSLTITLDGIDVDGDSITPDIVSQPNQGVLSSLNGNDVTYTANRGYVGSDSFQFTMSDGDLVSSPATITISVTSGKSATGTVQLQRGDELALNVLLGLSSQPGNTHKLMDSCQINGNLYAAGIQTADIAVKYEGIIDYVDSGITDFIYKNIRCGNDFVFVVTADEVLRIDTSSLSVTGRLDFSNQDPAYYQNFAYDFTNEKIFVSFIGEKGASARVLMYDAITLELLHTFSDTRSDFYINNEGDIIAVNTSGSNSITVYDGITYEQKSSVVVRDASFVSGTAYDVERNRLWWFSQKQLKTVNLDSLNQFRSITSLDHGMPSLDDIAFGANAVVASCENCFDTRESNEINTQQGGIVVADASSLQIIYTLAVPYKHKSVMIDTGVGEVILSNNEEDSVSIIDMTTAEIHVEDIGNGFEWMEMDNRGVIHLANRLGGSTLESFNPETFEMRSLTVEEWPVGLVYDENEERLVTFNHLGNGFSFFDVDPISSEVTLDQFIDLTGIITTPDYDSIGDVAYDKTHGVAYGAIPELNQVVVLDSQGATQVIDLPYAGDSSKGAGIINLAVYEDLQYLFVYYRDARLIYVYDGSHGYSLMDEIVPADGWGDTNYPYSLYVDGDLLYVGPRAYNMETLSEVGRLRYGYRLIGIDEDFGIALLLGVENDMEYLYAVSTTDQTLLGQIELKEVRVTTGHGIYDSITGIVYILHPQDSSLIPIKIFQ